MKTRGNTTIEKTFLPLSQLTVLGTVPVFSGDIRCQKSSNVLSIFIDIDCDSTVASLQNIELGELPDGYRPSVTFIGRIFKYGVTDFTPNGAYDLVIKPNGKVLLLAFSDSGVDGFKIQARFDLALS